MTTAPRLVALSLSLSLLAGIVAGYTALRGRTAAPMAPVRPVSRPAAPVTAPIGLALPAGSLVRDALVISPRNLELDRDALDVCERAAWEHFPEDLQFELRTRVVEECRKERGKWGG